MDARQFENLSELESVPVSNDTLLDDLKAQILDKLVAAGKVPVETAPRQLRLRSFIYNRADSFLKNNERPITECGVPLYDGRQLCVQVLDEPENLSLDNVNDVVVLVQRWHRSTWTLGECREVCLRNDMPLRDIATGLGEMMSIEPRNMRVLVVRNHSDVRLRYLNMATPRLSLESWLDPYSESPTRTLAQAKRLFFSDLLLIQDVTEPLYELTPSDKLSIQLVDLTENSYGNARSYQSYDGYDSLYSTQNGCELSLVSPSATRSGGGIKIKIHSRQSSVVDEKPNEISKDDTETTEGVNNNDNNHINPLFNDL